MFPWQETFALSSKKVRFLNCSVCVGVFVCVCGPVFRGQRAVTSQAIKPSQSVTGGRANAIIQFGSGEFANYCGNVIDK